MSRDFQARRPPHELFGRSFLIVTEDSVVEPEYFQFIRSQLRRRTIDIEVTHSPKGTAADQVVEYAVRRKKERQAAATGAPETHGRLEDEETWAVFDMDTAIQDGKWSRAQSLARDHGVYLAHSHPCFEYWILLHWNPTSKPMDTYEKVRAELVKIPELKTYEKKRGRMLEEYATYCWQRAPAGVKNARQRRQDRGLEGRGYKDPPYTHVDHLLVGLNASASPVNYCPGMPLPPPNTPPDQR